MDEEKTITREDEPLVAGDFNLPLTALQLVVRLEKVVAELRVDLDDLRTQVIGDRFPS